MTEPQAHHEIDVAALGASTTPDAYLVVIAAAMSRLAVTVFVLGIVLLAFVGGSDALESLDLTDAGETFGALFSPLAGIVTAIGLRIAGAGVGMLAAYRRAYETTWLDVGRRRGAMGLIQRRIADFQIAGAYATLRRTAPIRRAAAAKTIIGAKGEQLFRSSLVVVELSSVLVLVLVKPFA